MSLEYTIDIQLTELGFPGILQPPEIHVTETPCVLASQYVSPTPIPTKSDKRQLENDHSVTSVTRKCHFQQTTDISGSSRTQRRHDVQTGSMYSVDEINDSMLTNPIAGGPANIDILFFSSEAKTHSDSVEEEMQQKGQGTVVDAQETKEDNAESTEDSEDEDEESPDEDEVGPGDESDGTGKYRCGVCDIHLPSNTKLQEHMNLHTGKRPYCCAECGKRFCQFYNYRAHLKTHAQAQADSVRCRVCRKIFKTEERLKVHLSTTHFEKVFYECDLCKRVFTDLTACQQHVDWHKRTLGPFTCETCGRRFSHQKSLTRHRARKCQRNFVCTDCSRTFIRKNSLLKHSFSHVGLLPYTCLRCRCHFRLAKLYRQHKCEPQRIHCVACLRVFLSQEDFQKHKKDTGCWGHQEPKGDEIRCPECGESFATKEELKKHGSAHQRILICAECGKGFRSALLLMSHMGGHAGQTPCLCQSCGLGFPHQQEYDCHLKKCGSTSPPAGVTKKHQSRKSSLPSGKSKPVPTIMTASTSGSGSANEAVTIPRDVIRVPATSPVNFDDVTEDVASPADGTWRLTLDKPPPPGLNLVLFVPVNSALASGLVTTGAPSAPQTLPPAPAVQAPSHVALPPIQRTELAVEQREGTSCPNKSSVIGSQLALDIPLQLVSDKNHGQDYVAPLDLSQKTTSLEPAVSICTPVKVELEDPEFCDHAYSFKGEMFQGVKNNLQERAKVGNAADNKVHAAIKLEPDTTDSSLLAVEGTAPLVIDIKEEPVSPSPVLDVLES